MSTAPPRTEAELIERALVSRDRLAIATMITRCEDARPTARGPRAALLSALADHPKRRRARLLGITGTPGSGKSTLIGELARRLLSDHAELTVAVLAVDPSSHVSGGALLGDRTRVRFGSAGDPRFFFRSQASQTELGGLGPVTFQVCRLLYHLFDVVFVETVGVGQNEVDIGYLADRVYLVMTPLGGDELQFLKAGIMEIPDTVILNKSDAVREARRSYHALRSSLALARPFDAEAVEIVLTSCVSGQGLDDLATGLLRVTPRELTSREAHFFASWTRLEWGRQGLRLLGKLGGAPALLLASGGFEAAQDALGERVRAELCAAPA